VAQEERSLKEGQKAQIGEKKGSSCARREIMEKEEEVSGGKLS